MTEWSRGSCGVVLGNKLQEKEGISHSVQLQRLNNKIKSRHADVSYEGNGNKHEEFEGVGQ